jgi:MFS family permease
MLPAIVLVGAWMLGPALAAPLLNIFFARRFDLPVAQIGGVFAAAHLIWGASVFLSGGIAIRFGTLRCLTVGVACFAPAMMGLAWSAALPLAITAFIAQGLIGPLTNPLIDQLLLERAPAGRQGLVSGWRNAAADVSALVGATAGGALLAATSFTALLAVASAVGLAGGTGLVYTLRSAPAPIGDARQGAPLPAGERDGP